MVSELPLGLWPIDPHCQSNISLPESASFPFRFSLNHGAMTFLKDWLKPATHS